MSVPSSSLTQAADSSAQTTASNNNTRVKVVAGYALQQKLGSGSFAVVYKGVRVPQHTPTDAADIVAIKAITRTSEKLTRKVLQNLEVEINILRSYRHRNIVCLHDVQKTEAHFYLILEYCGGGDVQKLIRTRKAGRITECLTRRLMRDLAAGLKFLWGHELVHRDIKPQNLLLTGPLPLDEVNDPEKTEELELKRREANFPSEQFVLKIADFGFARHLQTASLAETLCGSPLYMAPEILQHHRYDAKADLWSVGTVLFEMITGRPPFHGENHIDLLRNIQRKAVRLPPEVKVSKECVTLLRVLLNRNPISRAGFKEFFEACNAFVKLGCQGVATQDEGSYNRPSMDLGTIPENAQGAQSMLTVETAPPPQQSSTNVAAPEIVSPPLNPVPSPSIPLSGQQSAALMTRAYGSRPQQGLTPLVPSPPTTSASPIYNPSGIPVPLSLDTRSTAKQPWTQQASELPLVSRNNSTLSQGNSNEENSFVMVEHGSFQKSPASSAVAGASSRTETYRQPQARLEQSPPSSPGYYINRAPIMTTRGDYMVVKQPKGMLSTSPGTGGALMGILSGRARLPSEDINSSKQLETRISGATKMLAAAEDVGRRAISVAHLGDQRAYAAMRLVYMNESSSSLASATPMDGIEEEAADHDGGAITDDSSSTEIMASVRRRRSSSATDRSMTDAKAEEEPEEMPFAVNAESPPLLSTGIPSRESASFSKGTSITSSKPALKPTPAVIRARFSEALSCYLKALKMLKGAIAAAQRVAKDLESLSSQRLNPDQRSHVQKMKKRCDVTANWLGAQFKGVLERGDASNVEIGRLSPSQNTAERAEAPPAIPSAEELVYSHALGFGREGAVKQLLGQFELARSCYRTAGLLAETLLMESNMGSDDRKLLEEYVDGFAARITELDEVMLQQSRLAGSSATGSAGSSKRGPAVVGLVGQPFGSPVFDLGSAKK